MISGVRHRVLFYMLQYPNAVCYSTFLLPYSAVGV